MRSLHDLYDSTKNIDYLTLFYLFANCEPLGFEEVVQDNKMEKCYRRRDQGIKEEWYMWACNSSNWKEDN